MLTRLNRLMALMVLCALMALPGQAQDGEVAGARGANFNVRAHPAAYDNVIGVTGVTQDDVKGTDTGYGSYVDVAAPVDNVPTVAYDANPTQPSMRTPAETRPDNWPHIHATKNLEIFGRHL